MKQQRNRRRNPERCAVQIPPELTHILQEAISKLRPSVKADYLKQVCFSKYVSPDSLHPASKRRADAIFKWMCIEQNNAATNERLLLTPGEYNILPRVSYEKFVTYCQELIVAIIGETVPEEAVLGSFSGGASTSRNRTSSFPAGKFLGQADITSDCQDAFVLVQELSPGWLGDGRPKFLTRLRAGNELFTVPKDSEIDRCACKEPDINMYIQKGAGDYISSCLRRIGINLNDQTRNRSLAQEGSLTGRLATVDLKSASDSVTLGFVAEMLPVCWYTHLSSARSPVTIIDGEVHRNEMFSSMGNGFTFELESLLFYALAKAACYFTGIRGTVSVYGDDIIVPSEVYPSLEIVLEYFGFEVNSKKSFNTGPFRESCGGHYHDGIDITPFYVKEPLSSVADVIDVANKLRKWAEVPGLSVLNPEVEGLWFYLKSFIPKRLWGGVDTSFKYQLVSPDRSHSRLKEDATRKATGFGGYLHWLNTTWDRSRNDYVTEQTPEGARVSYQPVMRYPTWDSHGRDGVQTSKRTLEREDPVLFYKRVRTSVAQLQAEFLTELSSSYVDPFVGFII